jgi:hypothetical protein
VPYQTYRSLTLWFFVALQAMMPFIHAHAGAVQLNHSGFLHLHQGVHNDAAYHATATSEHGAEIDVEQGRPLRIEMLEMADAALPAASLELPRIAAVHRSDAGLPEPPPRFPPPAYTLPPTLAPPAA